MNSLAQLIEAMRANGARRFLWKPLARNDNSKNQIYLGGDFSIVNVIPASTPVAADSGQHDKPIFKSSVHLEWIDAEGRAHRAPGAQLILYPQYPEVRFSGFLQRAKYSPNEILSSRDEGRVLLLGITSDDRVLGWAGIADDAIAHELNATMVDEQIGPMRLLRVDASQSRVARRARLLDALCRVHQQSWIDAWRLGIDGTRSACRAPHCVGVTLESELGITANGRAEPDFDGWEVKAYSVKSFRAAMAARLTLMTPEPTGGIYRHEGVEAFVAQFGYPDKMGRADRRNFGGIHKVGTRTASTGLRMMLDGYDATAGKLTRGDGRLALLDDNDRTAAEWSFAGLLEHWSHKHANAVYVPARVEKIGDDRRYQYGGDVTLAVGTDYLRFLGAIASGSVFLDPAVKVVRTGSVVETKRRNQFRTTFGSLERLYREFDTVSVCQ